MWLSPATLPRRRRQNSPFDKHGSNRSKRRSVRKSPRPRVINVFSDLRDRAERGWPGWWRRSARVRGRARNFRSPSISTTPSMSAELSSNSEDPLAALAHYSRARQPGCGQRERLEAYGRSLRRGCPAPILIASRAKRSQTMVLLDEHLTAIDTALTHIGDSSAAMETPNKVAADVA